MLKLFVMLVVVPLVGYLIFRTARNAWKKVDVQEKLADVGATEENYEKVKGVDLKEVKKKQDAVDKFVNS